MNKILMALTLLISTTAFSQNFIGSIGKFYNSKYNLPHTFKSASVEVFRTAKKSHEYEIIFDVPCSSKNRPHRFAISMDNKLVLLEKGVGQCNVGGENSKAFLDKNYDDSPMGHYLVGVTIYAREAAVPGFNGVYEFTSTTEPQ